MSARIAAVRSIALLGLEGRLVDVETHVGRGLVAFTLVGLPDASLREAKDRVRSALQSCDLEVMDARITVNLSPAGLPKSGSGFDLAIAMSVLVAAGAVDASAFEGAALLAELGLDGGLRPVRGILPAVASAKGLGVRRVVVPVECVDEARLVPGIEVLGFAHLADVVVWAGGRAARPRLLERAPAPPPAAAPPDERDLADVRGQDGAVDALLVAAAGGHHLFLEGEPGAGKTMLASRLPGILPDLDDRVALETTALHSLAGVLPEGSALLRTPPFQAPHHSATTPALIGGGSGIASPGAVSLAHGGVLFLDEAAEFPPAVLDALRQPLEERRIAIHRSRGRADYPAAFQLVLASNPCPCGRAGRRCRCTSLQRRRYLSRLSGPLLDRIDITVEMRQPTRADLAASTPVSSAEAKRRVVAARARARARLSGTGWTLNAELPGPWLRRSSGIRPDLVERLDRAVDERVLSMRGADRVLRLMWTLADLSERDSPDETDLARALALRTGGPDARVGD
ncbi:YifB family Mg chelatase-like AAA ATPase [Actinomyces culturomici]|uniref:YifB family Mg chelatase-like AAA ATPase n=1 Tax=Actinomyces culturomici TaxID=1926276 RepID=UPI000E1FDB64|nr:YifB family Mg chelatase-like AAA ATPase [Actinomyces culturomici]